MLKPIILADPVRYTPENVDNKVNNFDFPDEVTYPTTMAVVALLTGGTINTLALQILTVNAEAYGTSWAVSNQVPTKRDLYARIEAIASGTTYTDEQAQDAVGNILVDSSTIDFTYTDAIPSITAIVKDASITLAKMANMATTSFLGRTTAGSGVPEVLSVGAVQSMLSISGANTGDQFLFRTIAVAGQSNVVADSTTDTLILAAGANVTITTDATTDTITIAAAGGGGGGGTLADPSAVIGLTQINGVASTGIRSDGAPALSQAIAPVWTAIHKFAPVLAANTSGTGIALDDLVAATSGNQQYSPRVRFTGQGFKSAATAGSQQVDATIELRPVQGTANPTSLLAISTQVNSGGYTDRVTMTNFGVVSINPSTNLATSTLKISGSDTVYLGLQTTNTSSAGLSLTRMLNDTGVLGEFGVAGSAYTGYGALAANDAIFYSSGSVSIMADGTGVVKFSAKGNTERMRLGDGLMVGTTTDPGVGGLRLAGDLIVTGNITFGGTINGGALPTILTAIAILDFPSTASYSDLTITVTGAAVGDPVALGIPPSGIASGGPPTPPDTYYTAWVSSTNTVTVRFHTGSTINPSSGTFRVAVFH